MMRMWLLRAPKQLLIPVVVLVRMWWSPLAVESNGQPVVPLAQFVYFLSQMKLKLYLTYAN